MKSTRRLLLPLLCASLVTGAALAVLRTFLMMNYYNTEESLYKAGTDLPGTFFLVFSIAFFLIGICGAFIKPNGFNSVMPCVNIPVTFSGAFCGFLFTSASILQLVYFAKEVLEAEKISYNIIFFGMILFGLLSALYFFKVSATSSLRILSEKYTSFSPIIWAIFYLIFIYFDSSVVLNNPERELIQLAAIASLLYCTSESRYQLGIAKPRLYFPVALASIIILLVVNVPNVILTAVGVLRFTTHTIYSFSQIGLLLYIITRIFSFTTSKPVTRVVKEETTAV